MRGSTGAGRRTGSTTRTDTGRGNGGREIATEKGELVEINKFEEKNGQNFKLVQSCHYSFGPILTFTGKLDRHRMRG